MNFQTAGKSEDRRRRGWLNSVICNYMQTWNSSIVSTTPSALCDTDSTKKKHFGIKGLSSADHTTLSPDLPKSGGHRFRLNPSQDARLAVYVNHVAPGPR